MDIGNLKPGDQARLNDLQHLLEDAKITFSILAHDETITTAEEGVDKGLGKLSVMAPTFILSSEAGFIAAIIRGDTRLSYRKIKKQLGLKNISLAAPDIVLQVTGSEIGAVALIQSGLETIMDLRLLEADAVYGGCGVAHFTLKISPKDVAAITHARVFDFTEMKAESLG
jgi:prolyl-tRNA editing enzyme YbaK/EbsC (Cys-tRNA(Pro) deacylase)